MRECFYMDQNSTIYVIRHGEASSNEPDAPLTEVGQKQAQQLAEFLSRFTNNENSRLISSPYLRASKTAEIVAARINQTFSKDKRLQERNIGDYQGSNLFKDLKNHFSDTNHRFPNGESNGEVRVRAISLIDEIRHDNQHPTFLFTHRLTMMILFNYYDQNWDFDKGVSITNPDVYELQFVDERPSIRRVWSM